MSQVLFISDRSFFRLAGSKDSMRYTEQTLFFPVVGRRRRPNTDMSMPFFAFPSEGTDLAKSCGRIRPRGHGSVDTLPILAAIAVPGGKRGVDPKPIRIGDLGATAASLMGLKLRSTMIGQDLSGDLASRMPKLPVRISWQRTRPISLLYET
jgi:hypothetical protein